MRPLLQSTHQSSSSGGERSPSFPNTFFWGGYIPVILDAIVAMLRTVVRASMVQSPWPPKLPDPPWPPESPVPPWPPELPDPPWPPESPDPPWRLPQSLCQSPASRAPTPPPRCYYYGAGRAFREGEVLSRICLSCSLSNHSARPHLVSLIIDWAHLPHQLNQPPTPAITYHYPS